MEFNIGTTERWKSEMSEDDLALCDNLFGTEIFKMGYQLTQK